VFAFSILTCNVRTLLFLQRLRQRSLANATRRQFETDPCRQISEDHYPSISFAAFHAHQKTSCFSARVAAAHVICSLYGILSASQSPGTAYLCGWAIDRSGEKVNTSLSFCSPRKRTFQAVTAYAAWFPKQTKLRSRPRFKIHQPVTDCGGGSFGRDRSSRIEHAMVLTASHFWFCIENRFVSPKAQVNRIAECNMY